MKNISILILLSAIFASFISCSGDQSVTESKGKVTFPDSVFDTAKYGEDKYN